MRTTPYWPWRLAITLMDWVLWITARVGFNTGPIDFVHISYKPRSTWALIVCFFCWNHRCFFLSLSFFFFLQIVAHVQILVSNDSRLMPEVWPFFPFRLCESNALLRCKELNSLYIPPCNPTRNCKHEVDALCNCNNCSFYANENMFCPEMPSYRLPFFFFFISLSLTSLTFLIQFHKPLKRHSSYCKVLHC